jgi:carbon storage regulator
MLVLSRRNGEEILVGDNVVVKVLSVGNGRVRVGIEAPRDVLVRRSELLSDDRIVSPASKTRRMDIATVAELAGIAH